MIKYICVINRSITHIFLLFMSLCYLLIIPWHLSSLSLFSCFKCHLYLAHCSFLIVISKTLFFIRVLQSSLQSVVCHVHWVFCFNDHIFHGFFLWPFVLWYLVPFFRISSPCFMPWIIWNSVWNVCKSPLCCILTMAHVNCLLLCFIILDCELIFSGAFLREVLVVWVMVLFLWSDKFCIFLTPQREHWLKPLCWLWVYMSCSLNFELKNRARGKHNISISQEKLCF